MTWWNPNPTIYVRNPDAVSAWIKYLHLNSGMTFRQIQRKPYFCNIPPGTLCAVVHGYEMPNKYRKKLGLPLIVKVPETHTYNPDTHALRAKPNGRAKRKRAARFEVAATVDSITGQINKHCPELKSEIVRILADERKE